MRVCVRHERAARRRHSVTPTTQTRDIKIHMRAPQNHSKTPRIGKDDPDGVRGIYLSRNILPVSSRAIKENLRRLALKTLPLRELARRLRVGYAGGGGCP